VTGQLRHVNARPTLIVPKDGKQKPVIAKVSQETLADKIGTPLGAVPNIIDSLAVAAPVLR
jgi:hypothetical protein